MRKELEDLPLTEHTMSNRESGNQRAIYLTSFYLKMDGRNGSEGGFGKRRNCYG